MAFPLHEGWSRGGGGGGLVHAQAKTRMVVIIVCEQGFSCHFSLGLQGPPVQLPLASSVLAQSRSERFGKIFRRRIRPADYANVARGVAA